MAGRSPTEPSQPAMEPRAASYGDEISWADVLAIFVHRRWTASAQVHLALHAWRSGTSQECLSAVHSDTPAAPHVVHIAIHKQLLTILDTGPSFAKAGVPGLQAARRFWGREPNGLQRSERLLAMSLRCPGTPAMPQDHGHAECSRNVGTVGIACHAEDRETSVEARAAASVARSQHTADRYRLATGSGADRHGWRGPGDHPPRWKPGPRAGHPGCR